MKNNIKSRGLAIALLVLAIALIWGAWTFYNIQNESERTVVAATDERIYGQWNIVSFINVALSEYEIEQIDSDQAANYYISFDKTGNMFQCTTDCNTISGTFSQTGSSLTFSNMMATEMACDNMSMEDSMKELLPMVTDVAFITDSRVSLKDSFGRTLIRIMRMPTQ